MSSTDVALRTAGLLNVAGASEPRSLSQLAALATRQIPACSGAVAALWRDGELDVLAASHPDLSELIDIQLSCGRGPVIDVLASGGPVTCSDTLGEVRWPEFAGAALRLGVRCTTTLARIAGQRAVTLTLFGARRRLLGNADLEAAEQLMTFGGTAMGNAAEYGEAQRTALQLRASADSRAVVDEARVQLMRTLGCDWDEALDRMKQISQATNLKVTEVASRIVSSGGLAGSM
jgi:hypothetical protein